MNYYKFNIGDYAAATRHLNIIEHGAYRLLLDLYYTSEQPLPADIKAAARKAGARTPEEVQAVEVVLQEFFVLGASGWVHTRCDAEIAAYHQKAENNRIVGSKGGRPRKETQTVTAENPEKTQTVNCGFPEITLTKNQEPLTKNQEPINTKNTAQRKSAACVSKPADVDLKVWDDFLILRKTKRLPLTETAMAGLEREMQQAGLSLDAGLRMCCELGWAGFKSEWLANKQLKRQPIAESFAERDARVKANRMAEFAPTVAARSSNVYEIFDLEVNHVAIACH